MRAYAAVTARAPRAELAKRGFSQEVAAAGLGFARGELARGAWHEVHPLLVRQAHHERIERGEASSARGRRNGLGERGGDREDLPEVLAL